jgi:hypothetical protein
LLALLASACADPIFAEEDANAGDAPGTDADRPPEEVDGRDTGSIEDARPSDDDAAPTDAGASNADAAATDAGDAATAADAAGSVFLPGKPGCGLDAAAFCATFDDVTPPGLGEGRAAELDPREWSGARMQPGLNFGPAATAVRLATIPACRSDLPSQVYPGQDALVCSGNELIQSRHLLMAAAEQNSGQLSLRIRRPFDFSARTGKVVFDAEGKIVGLSHGWVSIAVTESPSPTPSFGTDASFENGAVPRAGVEAHLFQICGRDDRVGVAQVSVFREYQETFYTDQDDGRSPTCVQTERGALNRFELHISRTRVEVFGTARSTNGLEFGPLKQLFSLAVDLPFERGYVHITTHNHASLAFSEGKVDAWTARWDNVGFDGPVIDDLREYSVADANEEVTIDGVACRNVGYQLGDTTEGPQQKLRFRGVDARGMKSAQLALVGHFNMNNGTPYTDYALLYRLNGQAWQTFKFDAAQLAMLNGPIVVNARGERTRLEALGVAGAVSLSLPVDLASLVSGDNSVEFVTDGVPNSYRPYVANVDLVLSPR